MISTLAGNGSKYPFPVHRTSVSADSAGPQNTNNHVCIYIKHLSVSQANYTDPQYNICVQP